MKSYRLYFCIVYNEFIVSNATNLHQTNLFSAYGVWIYHINTLIIQLTKTDDSLWLKFSQGWTQLILKIVGPVDRCQNISCLSKSSNIFLLFLDADKRGASTTGLILRSSGSFYLYLILHINLKKRELTT